MWLVTDKNDVLLILSVQISVVLAILMSDSTCLSISVDNVLRPRAARSLMLQLNVIGVGSNSTTFKPCEELTPMSRIVCV